MRAVEALALAACGAVLFCTLAPAAQTQLFAAPSVAVGSSVNAGLAAAPGYVATTAPAFQMPAQPTEGQHSAAAFLAGAAVVAAVCSRGRVAAAVDGQEELRSAALSRRAMLSGLAASPLLAAALPAHASSKPIWAIRKGGIEEPMSVKQKCTVSKACKKDAAFPFSDRAIKDEDKRMNDALNKFKARQPPQPEEK